MDVLLKLVQLFVWPAVAIFALILLRKEIHILFQRLSGMNVKDGSFQFEKFQAQKNSILDVKDSLVEEFRGRRESLTIDQVSALIDQKLRSLDGVARRTMEQEDIRNSKRTKLHEKIKIAREDGVFIEARTQELSSDGIGFRTDTHLNRNEIVTIIPEQSTGQLINKAASPFMIVRVEPMGSEFYYGARVIPPENEESSPTTH